MQHGHAINMVFKRMQHVVGSNVGWCLPNMLRPFEQALTLETQNGGNYKQW